MAADFQTPEDKQQIDLLQKLIEREQAARSPAGVISFARQKQAKEAAKSAFKPAVEAAELKSAAKNPDVYKPLIGGEKNREKAAELQKKAIEEGLPPLGSIKSAQQEFQRISQEIADKKRLTAESTEQAVSEAISDLEKTKNKEMTPGEIFARSVIALAPALIGRAAGGTLGGVAGGEVGISALSQFEKEMDRQRQTAKDVALKRIETAREVGKQRFTGIAKQEEDLLKAYLELGLLPAKQDYLARLESLKAASQLAPQAKIDLETAKMIANQMAQNKQIAAKDAENLVRILSEQARAEMGGMQVFPPKEPKKSEEKKPGVGQQTLDRSFAKDYASWIESGGSAAVKSNIEVLENSIKELATTDYASGPLVQFAPDMMKQKGTRIKESIETAVQESLKRILGAAYTEREGRQVLARAFNPALQEEENMERASRVLVKLKAMATLKEEAIKYFEENDTLKGFKGLDQFNKIYSDLKGDVVTVGEGLQVPTQTEAKKDVPRVGPDGKIYYYNWNEKTGKWE